MADFHLKQGDLIPELEVTCVDVDNGNAPVDVSGASAITFKMRRPRDGVLIVDAAGVDVDGANGKVKYVWQAGDTDINGMYDGEFVLLFSGGRELTFPNYGYIKIKITNDLD